MSCYTTAFSQALLERVFGISFQASGAWKTLFGSNLHCFELPNAWQECAFFETWVLPKKKCFNATSMTLHCSLCSTSCQSFSFNRRHACSYDMAVTNKHVPSIFKLPRHCAPPWLTTKGKRNTPPMYARLLNVHIKWSCCKIKHLLVLHLPRSLSTVPSMTCSDTLNNKMMSMCGWQEIMVRYFASKLWQRYGSPF